MCRERKYPNESNASVEELAQAAKCAASARSQLRLLAIRALILGHDFCDVEELFSVTDKTLENWVQEFNEQSLTNPQSTIQKGFNLHFLELSVHHYFI